MIGIFDSGYGGLTVMKEVVARLPDYDYLYLGDNARTPYGNRSSETVTQFADEAVRFLFEQGAQLILFACFTASALALPTLQKRFLLDPASPYKDRKILGVLRPLAEYAAQNSGSGRIGVVGTRGTVNSGAFERELNEKKSGLTITRKACPLLVPLIEEQWHTKPEARMILKKYLRTVKEHNVDSLILGCTHYPVMMEDFHRIMGSKTQVINSGAVVAERLEDYLARHPEIESRLSRGKKQRFMTTDCPQRFGEFVKVFGGLEQGSVEQVQL